MWKFIKSSIKKNLKDLAYFYSYLKYRIFIRMFMGLTIGILDSFGLAMFLPLLQMVDGKAVVEDNHLGNFSFLVNGLNSLGIELNLTNVLILLASFFMLKGVAVFFSHIISVNIRESFIRKIRLNLTTDLSNISFKAFVGSDVGRIQNTMSGEVSKLSSAYESYFDTVQHIILISVYMGFAIYVDPSFALLISVGGLLTNFLFKRIFTATKRTSEKITHTSHTYQGLIIQFVANFKYLKASGSLQKLNRYIVNTVKQIESDSRKIGKYHAVVIAAREPILIVVVALVIFLHVNMFGASLGTIMISLMFFYRSLSSLILMQASYNLFLAMSGSLKNMLSFEEELKQHREPNGTEALKAFSDSIELKNVTFGYHGKQVTKQVSLVIKKNKTVAFVGESGSGKTTLLNLIVNLLSPDNGVISIDGLDMTSLEKESYRQRIGYIAQEAVIFNDTIYNNVTLWEEPTETNLERFNRAMKQAAVYNFVQELDLKGETLLGNNGINISGGQKQRISIARELYKDIDILVLDEATSALDSETELSIQKNIDLLKGQLTILIVAHRLSTVRNADAIVLMNNGQIEAIDGFDGLYGNSQQFKRMVELQQF